jgi:hypothetical protein
MGFMMAVDKSLSTNPRAGVARSLAEGVVADLSADAVWLPEDR